MTKGKYQNRRRKQGEPYSENYMDWPEYRTWISMRSRCNNKKDNNYRWYGKLGVKVCPRWDDFLLFLEDMGERPPGLTLDRINPFGDYSPENCKWVSWEVQRQNTRKSVEKKTENRS